MIKTKRSNQPNGRHGSKYTQVALRLPSQSLDELRAKSRKDGRPMSEILRGAIELYCRTQGLPTNQRLAYVDISQPESPRLVSVIEFAR